MRGRVVLFLHPSDEAYGADRSLFSLVVATREIARPIVVVPSDLAYGGVLSARLRAAGVEVHVGPLPVLRRRYLHPLRLPVWIVRLVLGTGWLYRLARRTHADGIVSNSTAVMVGPVLAGFLRRPHIWYVREVITAPSWFRGLVRILSRASRGTLVGVSQSVAAWLGPIPDRGPIVGYNGVDIPETIAPFPKIPTAVFVGRLNSWKGADVFVRAAALVHDQLPASRFRVVGDVVPGDDMTASSFAAQVRQIDPTGTWLVWEGEQPNARAAMRNAWVVAVPSTRPDPFPNVVLEAMSEARPVVGSRAGGIPEMVLDGVTGSLVPPGNAPALAMALIAILRDARSAREMGQAGRMRSLKAFSRDTCDMNWRAILLAHLPVPSLPKERRS